jgi:hypothetical protein
VSKHLSNHEPPSPVASMASEGTSPGPLVIQASTFQPPPVCIPVVPRGAAAPVPPALEHNPDSGRHGKDRKKPKSSTDASAGVAPNYDGITYIPDADIRKKLQAGHQREQQPALKRRAPPTGAKSEAKLPSKRMDDSRRPWPDGDSGFGFVSDFEDSELEREWVSARSAADTPTIPVPSVNAARAAAGPSTSAKSPRTTSTSPTDEGESQSRFPAAKLLNQVESEVSGILLELRRVEPTLPSSAEAILSHLLYMLRLGDEVPAPFNPRTTVYKHSLHIASFLQTDPVIPAELRDDFVVAGLFHGVGVQCCERHEKDKEKEKDRDRGGDTGAAGIRSRLYHSSVARHLLRGVLEPSVWNLVAYPNLVPDTRNLMAYPNLDPENKDSEAQRLFAHFRHLDSIWMGKETVGEKTPSISSFYGSLTRIFSRTQSQSL